MNKMGITHNGKGYGVYVTFVVAILILAFIGASSLYHAYQKRNKFSCSI